MIRVKDITITCLLLVALSNSLHFLGRVWWCSCGDFVMSSWDVHSKHNSQHILDQYSFSHVLHGLVFFWALYLGRAHLSTRSRFFIAMVIEVVWEFMENTPIIIDRYRSVTVSLGYTGDSIANSLSDVACCMIGFAFAGRFGFRASALLFLLTEALLLFFIKDSLIINVIMLIWPLDVIKNWQMAAGAV